jgi:hypothetical protein
MYAMLLTHSLLVLSLQKMIYWMDLVDLHQKLGNNS